jgi:hypothetical protein
MLASDIRHEVHFVTGNLPGICQNRNVKIMQPLITQKICGNLRHLREAGIAATASP